MLSSFSLAPRKELSGASTLTKLSLSIDASERRALIASAWAAQATSRSVFASSDSRAVR